MKKNNIISLLLNLSLILFHILFHLIHLINILFHVLCYDWIAGPMVPDCCDVIVRRKEREDIEEGEAGRQPWSSSICCAFGAIPLLFGARTVITAYARRKKPLSERGKSEGVWLSGLMNMSNIFKQMDYTSADTQAQTQVTGAHAHRDIQCTKTQHLHRHRHIHKHYSRTQKHTHTHRKQIVWAHTKNP